MKNVLFTLIIVVFGLLTLHAILAESTVRRAAGSGRVREEIAHAAPVRLLIPSERIDAEVVPVGLLSDGSMETPRSAKDVGWFAPGIVPGEQGNAVFAGHLDSLWGRPAVFWNMQNLTEGDHVEVETASGRMLRFVVVRRDVYGEDAMPLSEVFGPSSGALLRLITCDGSWQERERRYAERLVVTAEMVGTVAADI